MPKRKKRTLPRVGTEFVTTFKGEPYKMKVVRKGDGIGYKVSAHIYASPSAAAKSISGTEVNGWVFWRI